MTIEQLMATGLTKEQAETVLRMHKEAIDGNYVPKARFETEREKVKSLEQQVQERDKQINELGQFKGTAEQLQQKVADLEKQNQEAAKKYQEDLLNVQKEAAIRIELQGKVIDADDVLPKLDMSKIVLEDGKIKSGLSEQIEALKKAKPHYFVQDTQQQQQPPTGWIFGKTPMDSSDSSNRSKDEAAEYGKMLAQQKAGTVSNSAENYYFK